MKKIGLLTCSNMTQNVGCSSFKCLESAYDRDGEFARYDEEVRVLGVVNCAGCPGTTGHEKILKRVNALAASGVSAIHMTSCMVHNCPFVAKYEKVIRQALPDLEVVRGTHAPLPPQVQEKLMDLVHAELTAPGLTVPQMGRVILESLGA